MNVWKALTGLAVIALVATSCSNEKSRNRTVSGPLFERLNSEESGIRFINRVENSDEMNIFNYRNFYNGGGVALGDINNDGLPDIYLTRNQGPNELYLNEGKLKFRDITASAGVGGTHTWSTGVVMADINADGLLDIYVCNAGYLEGENQQNELFINNGDLTFTEQSADYGLNEGGYTTHAAFFDYDIDGDLDAYILNNSFMPVNTLNYSNKRELKAEDWPVKDFLKGGGDKLLRNDNGRYVDVTSDAGIYSSLIGFGLGVTVGDINRDHYPDLYISNDFFERDYLYINQGDGTFREDIKNYMGHISLFSMGADLADINNDGLPEVFVTDMLPDSEERLKTTSSFETYSVYDLKIQRDFYNQYMHNTLQFNTGDDRFVEVSFYSGVAASDWSWGALMFDMDNDGYRDLYVCNGIYQDVTDQDFIDFFANDIIQKMALTGKKEEMNKVLEKMPSNPLPNKAFKNMGQSLKFEDVGAAWGFDEPSFSNGAAFGDLDNDGDNDLVINNVNQEAFVYRNLTDQTGQHYLTVSLEGNGKNTHAIGAKISLHIGDEIIMNEVIPSRGFQSSIGYSSVIGLGQRTSIDSMVIVWPDRKRSVHRVVRVDTTYQIAYPEAGVTAVPSRSPNDEQHLLKQTNIKLQAHREDDFVDFYYEGLLVKKMSNEGPALAVGDANADGLDDIFLGGARGQSGVLYLQTGGGFSPLEQPALEQHAEFEDTAAKWIDVDGDGDQDLYVGSGGNHVAPRTRFLQDRIYLNDGNGNLKLEASALPLNGFNTSAILDIDLDGDGDRDIVTLSRNIPFNYGTDPRSFVFENNGNGTFADVTQEKAPRLRYPGLITDAVIADIDGNGMDELILVGEWMAPKVFSINQDGIEPIATDLDNYSGWWNSVAASDLDGDGDQDLVLGNIGENFYLSASEKAPLRLWISDFDGNGDVENIISRNINGKDVPVPLKRELTEQLASLKKQNLKHADFAQRSIQELFTPEQLRNTALKEITTMSSVIAWNQGGGRFSVEALPPEAQFTCICGIACTDINGDDVTDILLVGNDYGFAPQFGRLDAIGGFTLIGQGDRQYQNEQLGLDFNGQGRDIHQFHIDDNRYFVVAVNNDEPIIFELSED